MSRKTTVKKPDGPSSHTRLTPKSAKDVKVIRISSIAYNAVYVLAEKNHMTMTDTVSFMVGVAWKQLYKMPINAPGVAGITPLEELNIALNRAVLKVLGPDGKKGAR